LGHRRHAGEVARGKLLDVPATKSGDRFLDPFGTGGQQVQATENGVNGSAASNVLDVFKGV
jgi:hypothetical protein